MDRIKVLPLKRARGCIYDFEHFHPLRGEAPEFMHHELNGIAFRARGFLVGRSVREVKYSLQTINWMLNRLQGTVSERLDRIAAALGKAIDSGTALPPDEPEPSDAQLLFDNRHQFDIDDQDGFPRASWEEYFAVLSLGIINDAAEEVHYRRHRWKDNFELDDGQRNVTTAIVAHYTISAMEAVCLADCLRRLRASKNELEAEHKQQTSLKAQRAAIQKNASTNSLLVELKTFYEKGQFKSMRAAVLSFIEKNPTERFKHLAPTNRMRTLSEGLSQLLRNKRRPYRTAPSK
jgi:hypothetical protein